MFFVRQNLCLRLKIELLKLSIVVVSLKNLKKIISLPFSASTNCKHLNSVTTKRLLDCCFKNLSARHAWSKVNATDLKFKIVTTESKLQEFLKSS